MSAQPLLVGVDDRGVATMTLNRPERHNAFDDVLIGLLLDALEALANNPAVRVLELTAQGRSFCAGADLEWMRRIAAQGREENLDDALRLGRMLTALATFPCPTIAVVQGAALGGGTGLVACCDIAVGSERASFALSEVKLGLLPATISPFVLAAIGPRSAQRYFLTAERFDAQEAHRLGLLHAVVAEHELTATADSLVDALLGNAPGALRETKTLIRDVWARPVDSELMASLAQRIAERRATTEGREGVAAFLEKRKPNWS